MANFSTMQNDLTLTGMASLVSTDIGTLLNKCQREECEAWEWSFLYTSVIINGNPGTVVGTVTMNQGSNVVTGVGTNFSTVGVQPGWWMWAGATQTTPVQILSVQNDLQLMLTAPWGAPSVVGTGLSIQPLYYDCYPLIEIYRVRQITYLGELSQAQLNRMDPSRLATGGDPSENWAHAPYNSGANPVTIVGGALTSTSHVQIELWPRCSNGLPYIVEGKMGSIDMVASGDMPLIPSAILEAKAMMYLARSAYMNSGDSRHNDLATAYERDYMRELENSKYADNKLKISMGLTQLGSSYRLFDAAIDYRIDRFGPS